MEKHAIPRYDDPKQVSWGIVAVNHEACNGCGLCARICPAGCLKMAGKKAEMHDANVACMMCGDCAAICSQKAITCTKSYRFGGLYKTLGVGELTPPRL